MKHKSLWMIALVALAACTKETPVEKPEIVETPGKVTMEFTAGTSALTRTSLGENLQVLWTEGDAISVFSDATPTDNDKFESSAIEATQATFKGKAMKGQTYTAVYPYSSENKLTGKKLNVKIPEEQLVSGNSFDQKANVAVAITDGKELSFENTAALVAFKIPALDEGNIVKGILKGNSEEKLAGAMEINLENAVKTCVPTEQATAEVTVTGSFQVNEIYYLVMAPGEYPQGLTLQLLDNAGNSYSAKIEENVIAEAGKVLSLTEVAFAPSQKPEDYYVKPDGKGSGFSWGEATTLKQALASAEDGNTIHMAAGTYANEELEVALDAFVLKHNVKIIGGYPATAKKGDAASPEYHETIISGSKKQNCLLIQAPKSDTHMVEISGIIFTDGKGNAETTGRTINEALIVKGRGGCVVVANSRTRFTDCNFIGNEGYSAPALYNADGAETTFENCKINGNSAGGNGCGVWNTHATFTAIRCEFCENVGTAGGVGGPVYNFGEKNATKTPTLAYIYNCLFKDNYVAKGTTGTSKRGGGIYNREGAKIAVVNCTFTGNTSGNGCGVSVYSKKGSPSTCTLISCTINGNKANYYGGLEIFDPQFNGEKLADVRVYNTIISGNTVLEGTPEVSIVIKETPIEGALPPVFNSSINGKDIYDNTGKMLNGKFISNNFLSPYMDGVIPLKGMGNFAKNEGMSVDELKAIDMSMFPDFDASFLGIDQQGLERTDKYMGASVK